MFTFLDIIGCDLQVTRYNNQNERWSAYIEHADVKEGAILSGEYGCSALHVIDDYVSKICGKLIVIDATGKNRREYNVLKNIHVNLYTRDNTSDINQQL